VLLGWPVMLMMKLLASLMLDRSEIEIGRMKLISLISGIANIARLVSVTEALGGAHLFHSNLALYHLSLDLVYVET
jgi:hypothetical protein